MAAIDDEMILRINELAKKKKEEGLTAKEEKEQKQLRNDYLMALRQNFKATMNNVDVVDELIVPLELEKVKQKLQNVKGLIAIEKKQGNTVIVYKVKEITKEEILKKFRN